MRVLGSILFALTLCSPAAAEVVVSISQDGITWTFDKPYEAGRFASGDYWVVGPAVITSVSPAPTETRNGSVVNPMGGRQGFDDRGGSFNTAEGVPFPYTLQVDESLVSSSPEFSPDVVGWRRERLPELPQDEPIRIAPDWICEVLSPTTRGYDLVKKRPFYARIGVSWLWYVDVEARSISVSQLREGAWVEVAIHGEDERVRLEPFPEVEHDLALWWLSGAER